MDLHALRALGKDGPVLSEGHRPKTPVAWSKDLERVLNLPMGRAWTAQDLDQMRDAVTYPGAEIELWDIQAEALLNGMASNGLFAPIAVGGGKTMVSALLPSVIECKRPVIMAPPGLVKEGQANVENYRRSFTVRDDLQWVPYSTLSVKSGAGLLDELQPDLIVADEAHTLTGDSARGRRFKRYMKEHPNTKCCFLSGTLALRSIMDFSKLMVWALGEGAPIPLHYPQLKEWAEALDVPGPDDQPRPMGALSRLCRQGEPVREAWQRRMRATPGIVASTANTSTSAKLEVVGVEPPCPPEIKDAQRSLHTTWETPDGVELMWAMEIARVERQLRLGGYYREVWGEDVSAVDIAEYKSARRIWSSFVREMLKRPKPGLDSPALIEDSIRASVDVVAHTVTVSGWAELSTWDLARARIKPPGREWVWLTDEVTLWAAGKAKQTPRIIFCDVTAVGQAVARAAGIPYYGAGNRAAEGILKEDGSRSIVASIQAHGQGRNLQMFCEALVLGGIPNGKVWEQLLGRLHRAGQMASVVRYEVAFENEVTRARKDAQFAEQILGTEQKLGRV